MAQLSFDLAFKYLMEGGMVTRESWLGIKGIFLKDEKIWALKRNNRKCRYTLIHKDRIGDDWVFVIGENTDDEEIDNNFKCSNTKCNQCHSS